MNLLGECSCDKCERERKLLFRRWFWECLEDFVDQSWSPPDMDNLKDAETYSGFRAVLEDAERKEQFIGEAAADGEQGGGDV